MIRWSFCGGADSRHRCGLYQCPLDWCRAARPASMRLWVAPWALSALAGTVLGMAILMHTSALAFQLLKYAGMACLFYVAWATWRDKSAFAVDGSVARTPARSLVIKAVLMNVLNPKLTIFFLAFLLQFVPHEASRPLLLQLLLLSAVFMAMTFAVFVIYGGLAHAFRRLVIESAAVQQWLRYGLASAFTGLGIKLALTEK